jgi:hypothetical protein
LDAWQIDQRTDEAAQTYFDARTAMARRLAQGV